MTYSLAGEPSPPMLDAVLVTLHYAYPTCVFLCYIVALAISGLTLQSVTERPDHPRRRLIQSLMLFSVLTYIAQCADIIIPSILARQWLGRQDAIISLLSCILVFGIQVAGLFDSEKPVWYPCIASYLLAVGFEPILAVVSYLINRAKGLAYFNFLELATSVVRYFAIGIILAAYFIPWQPPNGYSDANAESQPLLQKKAATSESSEDSQATDYGGTSDDSTESTSKSPQKPAESPWERREREAKERMEKRLKEYGNWVAYAKSFLVSPLFRNCRFSYC
jgi:hypothetical protein